MPKSKSKVIPLNPKLQRGLALTWVDGKVILAGKDFRVGLTEETALELANGIARLVEQAREARGAPPVDAPKRKR